MAEPAYPPMSACEELEGIPTDHVMMFQRIAPSNAPRITFGSTILCSIIPPPTAFATATPPVNRAAKLKKAAHTTAARGLRTRVPTIVAMEFAESWKPLLKSNRKAIPMIAMTYQTTRMAQAFLREMLCTAFATPMHWSIAISSVS